MKIAFFSRHIVLSLASCVALLTTSLPAAAAIDYFLTFDGVVGGSLNTSHKGSIDMASFNWGVSVANSGGGVGVGVPVFSDFFWTQVSDISSPILTGLLWNGTPIKTAVADFTTTSSAGGKPQTYFKMSFSDVLMSSIDFSGSNGGPVNVAGSFGYGGVTLDYWEIDAKGGVGAHSTASYDLYKGTGSVPAVAAMFAKGMAGPMVAVVPEPETYAMLLAGLGLMGAIVRRRKQI